MKLRDVCELINGRAYSKPELLANGKYRVLRVGNFFTNDHWYYSDLELDERKYCDTGDLLYAWSASFGPRIWLGDKVIFHYHIWKVVHNPALIDQNFLFLFFLWDTELVKEEQGTGTTMTHVSKGSMEDRTIRLPPLPEQKRIADILDETFDGIATAKANAEKNLQNARALFESHLQSVFTQHGDGWTQRRLSEISKEFGRGKSKHRPRNDPKLYGGEYPFIQTGDIRNSDHLITSYTQTYNNLGLAQSKLWPAGTVCITIAANIAETGILTFDACFPDSVIGIVTNESVATNKFLEYQLQSLKTRLQAQGKGSAQDNINIGTFENQFFLFPSIKIQGRIVSTLDALREDIQRLESIYQQKLAALEELKKSLLAKAFSGELTAKEPPLTIFTFPATIPNITTTDLHAGLIGIAHQSHEQRSRQDTLGHVKAEKIAHMVEAHLGIDLGRTPIKDAAGPNDYPHLKRVEHRSEKARFFTFQGSERAGYRIARGRNFDGLILRTRLALGARNQEIDRLIELMTPMNTEKAEIFSTVYAAWNNLLLDQRSVTDEDIVLEARENWHPEKLKIPRERFFKAIAWMKTNGFVPKGRGRKVSDKVDKKK
jgi:type I restriction enzyme S subunit